MKLLNAMAYRFLMTEIAPKVLNNLKAETNNNTNICLSWTEYRCIKCGKVFDTDRKCQNHINKSHKKQKNN